MWTAVCSFFSGGWGKILVIGSGLLALYAANRIESLKAELAAQESRTAFLSAVNERQQAEFELLLSEQRKNEEKLLAFEQEKKLLHNELEQKRKALANTLGISARVWKEQQIPEEILAVLKKRN